MNSCVLDGAVFSMVDVWIYLKYEMNQCFFYAEEGIDENVVPRSPQSALRLKQESPQPFKTELSDDEWCSFLLAGKEVKCPSYSHSKTNSASGYALELCQGNFLKSSTKIGENDGMIRCLSQRCLYGNRRIY